MSDPMSDDGELRPEPHRELVRRYRRLLRWYPRGHRRAHEEEMLGVLGQTARPGQTRPWLRDAVDIAWGGVRIRTRWMIRTVAGDHGWRDAFAVMSILLPLLMCTKVIQLAVNWTSWQDMDGPAAPPGLFDWSTWSHAHDDWPNWVVWPVVFALAVAGARRLAVVAAIGTTAAYVTLLVRHVLDGALVTPVVIIWWPLLGLLATVALALSPPRRGLTILGPWRLLAAGAATAVIGYAHARAVATGWSSYPGLIVPVVVAASALYATRTPVGRRAVIVLLVPYAWFKMTENAIDPVLSGHPPSVGVLAFLPATAILTFVAFAAAVYAFERTLHLVRIGRAAEDADGATR